MSRADHFQALVAPLFAAALAASFSVALASQPGDLPGPNPANMQLTNGIARPMDALAISKASECGYLGKAFETICADGIGVGTIFVHWNWKKSPCGAGACLTADEYRLTRKSGSASSLSTWSTELAHFDKGTWKAGDCFVVRAYNKAHNLESADSAQACAGLVVQPIFMQRAEQPTPTHT